MPSFSRRSQQIPFSPIRTMFRLADEMERGGGGPVFRLHVGDPDFTPPPRVIDAACDALKKALLACARSTTAEVTPEVQARVKAAVRAWSARAR